MVFIDKKGRLFGVVNIIDLGVIILLLFLALSFFYKRAYLKRFGYSNSRNISKTVSPSSEDTQAQVNVTNVDSKLQPGILKQVDSFFAPHFLYLTVEFGGYSTAVANAIKVGDKAEDGKIVVIDRVLSVEPIEIVSDRSGVYKHPSLKKITVILKANVEINGNKFIYDDKPLKLGSQFLLKTDRYDVNGEIINIQNADDYDKK
ncbi:MAG: DUF4330 family protein [Candidatus Omnitrophota bacterium]